MSALTGNLLGKCGTRRGRRGVRECLHSQGTCWVCVELGEGGEGCGSVCTHREPVGFVWNSVGGGRGAGVSALTGNLLGKCGTRLGGGVRECLHSQGTCWVSVELGGGGRGAGVSALTGNLLGKCGTRRGGRVRECLHSQGTCWVSVELGGGGEGCGSVCTLREPVGFVWNSAGGGGGCGSVCTYRESVR